MCMQNINTAVVFFEEGLAQLNNDKINLFNVAKKIPEVNVRFLTKSDQKTFVIDQLKFMLIINALDKNSDISVRDQQLVFGQMYDILLRISETSTGEFVNIKEFSFTPEIDGDFGIKLCRKIYHKNFLFSFSDIKVRKPLKFDSQKHNDLCVLKVLIKQHDSSEPWFLQSMYPIRMILSEK